MEERLASIFASLPKGELEIVSGKVLEAATAFVLRAEFTEIKKPHADPRTIGIVRVHGTASVSGADRPWSCVTKLIDLEVPNILGTSVDPRNEVRVYEEGHFVGEQFGLRPARCHHISRRSNTLTILWLEDLTEAEAPPFNVHQLGEMARHLGVWNARIAAAPPDLAFPIGHDFQITSAEGFNFKARMTDLLSLRDEPMVREMFARHPIEIVGDFLWVYSELIDRSAALPHALGLADCPISNFFHRPGETIVIDWAGLGMEPIGADGGRFIGSALSWGRGFAEIARQERALFECYLAGLAEGGGLEERDVIRSGYLSELGFYLASMLTLPTILARPKPGLSLEFLEKRLDMPMGDFGRAVAELVDMIPPYISELQTLIS